ncbi:vWA domain-containing protein [Eupransor demetentiae]|uniref:Predicted metal-dependent peptidase n=1 Tax=Eupransor demetentiae TaxID=3109584 RepID=A0ABM9N304_9LACO|nr:Predicted metal-dependent peptidase [Lactobacillaceae bacterium LMG 33000]
MTDKFEDNLTLAIKNLLDTAPLYGSVIMQLNRQYDSNQKVPLALYWQDHAWQLRLNPDLIRNDFPSADNFAQALAHEALHLIWQHPIRYAESKADPRAIQFGTDVTVNQYLIPALGPLPDAVTLATILADYKKLLAENQDSAYYVQAFEDLLAENPKMRDPKIDNSKSWESAAGAMVEAQAALKNILQQAQEDARRAGRGQVPAQVMRALQAALVAHNNWRRILSQALSNQPVLPKSSRARFNRRQPYRLDLPGQLAQQEKEVWIFVDQSASIPNDAVARFLAWCQQIQGQIQGRLHFYAFDSAVSPIQNLKIWRRQAAGGTNFQAIFDELKNQHAQLSGTVAIIFTDGQGEKQINNFGYQRVYWVLTGDQGLSLKQPFGRQLKMED